MAKFNNIENAKKAMESAALNEKRVSKKSEKIEEVTGNENNHPIHIRKFPKEWHDKLKADHVNNVTEYILSAVRERMKRDGIL